jgi:hypothetical protein
MRSSMSETDTAALEQAIEFLEIDQMVSARISPAHHKSVEIVIAELRRLLAVEESAVPVKWCDSHACTLEYRSVHGEPMRCSHAVAHGFDVLDCKFSDAVIYPGEPE